MAFDVSLGQGRPFGVLHSSARAAALGASARQRSEACQFRAIINTPQGKYSQNNMSWYRIGGVMISKGGGGAS